MTGQGLVMSEEYTKRDCIEALKEAKKKLERQGKEVTVNNYRELDISPTVRSFYNIFDSWNQAKEEADIELHNWYHGRVNQDYFRTINDKNKAYWLGFIYVDGSIYQSLGRDCFELGISVIDKGHLQKFKSDVDYKNKYTINNSGYSDMPQIRLCVGQKQFVECLIDKNATQDKISEGILPDINEEMKPHFIRGLYDADGYRTDDYDQWSITSKYEILLDNLKPWLPVESTIYENNRNEHDSDEERISYKLTVTGKESMKKLHKFIYPNGCQTYPILGRKFYPLLESE